MLQTLLLLQFLVNFQLIKKKEKAKQLPNQFQNVSRLLQFFLKGNRSNEMIIKAFSLFIYFFPPNKNRISEIGQGNLARLTIPTLSPSKGIAPISAEKSLEKLLANLYRARPRNFDRGPAVHKFQGILYYRMTNARTPSPLHSLSTARNDLIVAEYFKCIVSYVRKWREKPLLLFAPLLIDGCFG